MSNNIFYLIYFEGNGFQAFGDWFSGAKNINKKGPYPSQNDAANDAVQCSRACIVYNAMNQSFLNDTRHAGYAYDSIHNLISWAKQNIPIVTKPVKVDEPVLDPPPIVVEPIINEPQVEPAHVEPVPTPLFEETPRWCFYEHNIIEYEQETLDISVEIGTIAMKVYEAIKAYGGDFLSIAELAKGITFNIGLGMKKEKGINEYLKEVEDASNNTSSYVIIKFEKSNSSNKIKVPGIFSRNKKVSLFKVDYHIFKPKNKSACTICEELLNSQIQHKINFLRVKNL